MTSILRGSALTSAKPRRLRGILALFWNLSGLRRQRAHLARLDDRALRDIGLTRADAQNEASRPIWDVPSNWRG